MLKTFEIANFRGIKTLELDKLERINILTGKNSSSKTSLLEALFMHAGADNASLAVTINNLRGINWLAGDIEQSFGPLFYNGDLSTPVSFRGWDENKQWNRVELAISNAPLAPQSNNMGFTTTSIAPKSLKVTYSNSRKHRNETSLFLQPDGQLNIEKGRYAPTKGVYISSALVGLSDMVNRFNKVDTSNQKMLVIEMMKHVEPRIRDLSIGMLSNNPVLFVDLGLQRKIPLNYAGEGLQKICNIALAFVECAGGILLIDEIENGFHYSVLPLVWSTIAKLAAEYKTQLFVTTHSWECLVTASKIFDDLTDLPIQIYRLDRMDEGHIAVTAYDQKLLTEAVESGIEVR